MRVVDSCLRFVYNPPVGVQNALGDSYVFEYFEVIREPGGLPDLFPYCGIGVREVAIFVAQAHSVPRHLYNSGVTVHGREGRTSLQSRFRLWQLAPVNSPDGRIGEIAK